jgi:phosphoribosyl 1,2-cyclic phosphodiesterase
MRELKLNKQQFVIFNDYDQFQLFTDDEGSPDYEDFDAEVDKLFLKYDCIIVDEEDYIYGEKDGKRELIAPDSYEAFGIALEVLEDEEN